MLSDPTQPSLFSVDPGRDPVVESWSKVISRRMQSLVMAFPIHQTVNKASSGHYPHWKGQNFTFLTLQIFDAVFARMAPGIGHGATREQIIGDLRPYILQRGPELDHLQVEELVDFLLSNLMNEGRGSFEEECIRIAEDDDMRAYPFRFSLLNAYHDPEADQFVIRATPELIHIYLRMLDHPVEDEQIANLIILQEQVRRGRVTQARQEAERTMLLSLEYERYIGQMLRAVRRDVRSVDWLREVTPKIEEAHNHVQRLIQDQGKVMAELKKELQIREDDAHLRAIRELITMLEACQRRHMELEKRILAAGPAFVEEQSYQRFRGMARSPMPNLNEQVLIPALRLPDIYFRPRLSELYRLVLGPRIHRLFDIEVFVEKMLREDANFEQKGDEEDSDQRVPVDLFFDPMRDEMEEKIARILVKITDRPIRLSSILEMGRMENMDTHELSLIGVTLLSSYHEKADVLGLKVIKDGRLLEDEEFIGDDLIITRKSAEEGKRKHG